jgi:hypothetical protein
MKMDQEPLLLRRPVFVIGSFVLALLFSLFAYWLYVMINQEKEFTTKLGELALQIAILVIAGAAVKEFVDWRITIRTSIERRKELRREFLQRLRDIHAKIMYSRDLMRAHQSAKTWSEQSRNIMQIINGIEELSEDLKASPDLFTQQDKIISNIEGIVSYLDKGRDEYIQNHDKVESAYKDGRRLIDAVKIHKMAWVDDFMNGNNTFETQYILLIRNAKAPMRQAVYQS